jgi:hypothetical protein
LVSRYSVLEEIKSRLWTRNVSGVSGKSSLLLKSISSIKIAILNIEKKISLM